MVNILTVYFSLKGQTIAPGMKILNLEKGNTAVVAEYIQKTVGGDIFEIETVKTYIEDHFEMIEEAKKELENKTRVEVKNYLENLEDYDTIFLGYPNWWNTLPMVVVTLISFFLF
jgi:flavodoxin